MFDFENTGIWQRTLARKDADAHAAARDHLRVQFLRFRENAGMVAEEIKRAYPTLTVHGLTHLDALWEMADIILGPDYPLNPAEAFVLGGAFLVHDLGNGLAAYQGGEAELRSKKEWKDALAARIRGKKGRAPKRSELEKPSPELAQFATEDALRVLHARQAEKLALISWKGPRGEELHLIEDPAMRKHFGKLIGEIAFSHWWSVSEVASRFNDRRLGAATFMSTPRDWSVDILKVACLLRVSDAAHIDERRAPRFLMTLRRPQGVSKDHWTFQGKLSSKPELPEGKDRLIYTAGESFSRDEAEAFWICFDTLQMINRELRDVDALLTDKKKQRFAARGVADVDDARRLADQHISTEGWTPVDARLHVSDLPSLVSHLGGTQLYGNDPTVPLRELIQNAADAVRARRALQGKGEDRGKIILRQGEDAHGLWLEIEDTGLGMTERVLTRHLLDFGKSYWSTEDMRREHPGLAASTFQPTGRFGIGFFSVFMWSERLRVTSRPHLEGEKTRVLEFHQGLRRRPLLRPAEPEEQLHQGGTRVRVWISDAVLWNNLFHDRGGDWESSIRRLSLVKLVRRIAPTLDVTVEVEKKPGQCVRAITASDWSHLDSVALLKRTGIPDDDMVRFLVPRVRPLIRKTRTPVGRVCLAEGDGILESKAIVTVGGLRASVVPGLAGVLLGHTDVATRNEAKLIARREDIALWATEQARAWLNSTPPKHRRWLGTTIIRLGGDSLDLPVVSIDAQPFTLAMFEEWVMGRNVVFFSTRKGGHKPEQDTVILEIDMYMPVVLIQQMHIIGDPLLRRLTATIARVWGVKSGEVLVEDRFGQWRVADQEAKAVLSGQRSSFRLRRPE